MLHKTRARNARPYGYDGTISSYFFRNIVGARIARPLFGICAKFRICSFTVYTFIVAQSFGNFKWGRTLSGDKLLQSRCARQLPRRGSSFGRFMIPCFFIRRNSFYLQSGPPSSRDVFRRRRQWRIQTMKNAEGWHAAGVTEGVVSRSHDGSRKKFVPRFTDVL